MKLLRSITLVSALVCLTLTGCDRKPANSSSDSKAAPVVVDEKTALANFKTEVESVGTWIEEKQKAAATNPAAEMAVFGEIAGRVKTIKTDGLPADLKGAWDEMGVALGEMGDILKGMPKPDASKPEEAGKILAEIVPKMMAMNAKMEPISKKLEELGKKYGLDLSKVVPGK